MQERDWQEQEIAHNSAITKIIDIAYRRKGEQDHLMFFSDLIFVFLWLVLREGAENVLYKILSPHSASYLTAKEMILLLEMSFTNRIERRYVAGLVIVKLQESVQYDLQRSFRMEQLRSQASNP